MTKVDEKKVSVNFRIDKSEKERASRIYSELGLNLSTAVNMFIKKSIMVGGLPFEANDPFYSKQNLDELERRLKNVEHEQTETHELLEDKEFQ